MTKRIRPSPEPLLDILIPAYERPAALAVNLAALAAQTFRGFRIFVSDQSEDRAVSESGELRAVVRLLHAHGQPVEILRHLPRMGMAEQRQFLLERARAPHVLFLDDDLILEPYVVGQLYRAIRKERCGFIGCAPIGLSYVNDRRPYEQAIEFWDGPVRPETVIPGGRAWERYRLHNAANLYHVQERLRLTPEKSRAYRVAWVGGCVIYDRAKLTACGGFSFWQDLPSSHCGEDVLAQLRVMRRYGGCGLIPSGVYHQELPTTVPDRSVNAAKVLALSDLENGRDAALLRNG